VSAEVIAEVIAEAIAEVSAEVIAGVIAEVIAEVIDRSIVCPANVWAGDLLLARAVEYVMAPAEIVAWLTGATTRLHVHPPDPSNRILAMASERTAIRQRLYKHSLAYC